jgi:BMFP domain-containing protein YqiC
MSQLLWNTLKACPTVLGATLLVASAQIVATAATEATTDAAQPSEPSILADSVSSEKLLAQANPGAEATTDAPVNTSNLEQLQRYTNEVTGNESSEGQITNASQFRDVQPSDWAFEALDRIVQRYGCLVGYPDGTYRGNRALSRYEFAAGLNACLRQIETLISNRPDSVSRTDFESLQRLTEEFRTELATLGTRVDNLEGRTAFLEQRQFSTTTKLAGEAIFAVSDVFGEENNFAQDSGTPDANLPSGVNTILSDRVRISLNSSFTGKDRLLTRLQARNTTPFADGAAPGAAGVTGTNMTRLGFDGSNNNAVDLDRLQYRFPLGSVATVYLDATGARLYDNMPNFNPLLASSGSGSISRFGRFNPIYRQAREGTALTLDTNFSRALGLSLSYSVPQVGGVNVASVPTEGNGLFDGSYAALGQLTFRPSDAFNLGLTYVHSYNPGGQVSVTGSTGSTFANQPFGGSVATTGNHYGVQASLRLSPRFVISGWGGFTNAIAEQGITGQFERGADADIWNYAVTFAFPDLGKKGNLLGFVAGVPPRAASNEFRNAAGNQTRVDRDVSYHLEGFYRYRLTDNIDITPGLFVILNPEHNDNNDPLYVGTVRTTFRF